MSYKCDCCGTSLNHINEACPNCLPSMAERPPTSTSAYRGFCSRCKELEAELADCKTDLRLWVGKYAIASEETVSVEAELAKERKKILGISVAAQTFSYDKMKAERDKLKEDLHRWQTKWEWQRDYILMLREALKMIESYVITEGNVYMDLVKVQGIARNALTGGQCEDKETL